MLFASRHGWPLGSALSFLGTRLSHLKVVSLYVVFQIGPYLYTSQVLNGAQHNRAPGGEYCPLGHAVQPVLPLVRLENWPAGHSELVPRGSRCQGR